MTLTALYTYSTVKGTSLVDSNIYACPVLCTLCAWNINENAIWTLLFFFRAKQRDGLSFKCAFTCHCSHMAYHSRSAWFFVFIVVAVHIFFSLRSFIMLLLSCLLFSFSLRLLFWYSFLFHFFPLFVVVVIVAVRLIVPFYVFFSPLAHSFAKRTTSDNSQNII